LMVLGESNNNNKFAKCWVIYWFFKMLSSQEIKTQLYGEQMWYSIWLILWWNGKPRYKKEKRHDLVQTCGIHVYMEYCWSKWIEIKLDINTDNVLQRMLNIDLKTKREGLDRVKVARRVFQRTKRKWRASDYLAIEVTWQRWIRE